MRCPKLGMGALSFEIPVLTSRHCVFSCCNLFYLGCGLSFSQLDPETVTALAALFTRVLLSAVFASQWYRAA